MSTQSAHGASESISNWRAQTVGCTMVPDRTDMSSSEWEDIATLPPCTENWSLDSKYCEQVEELGDARVAIGAAYNRSSTDAVVSLTASRGGGTIPFAPVTGEARTGLFVTEMEFAQYHCRVPGTVVGPLYDVVALSDTAGGSATLTFVEPMPEFPESECRTYDGPDVVGIDRPMANVPRSFPSRTRTTWFSTKPGRDVNGAGLPYQICDSEYQERSDLDPAPVLLRDVPRVAQ